MKDKMDSINLLILRELRDNSRRSIRELSVKLKMHPNTLMQRIKKLERDGLIRKYVAEIDYSKLGYDVHAIVSIKVTKEAKSDWKILNELRAFKDIVSLYAATGTYDLVAIIRTKSSAALTDLISELNKKQYIAETNTLFLLYPFKHAYEFNPL